MLGEIGADFRIARHDFLAERIEIFHMVGSDMGMPAADLDRSALIPIPVRFDAAGEAGKLWTEERPPYLTRQAAR